MSIRLLLVFFLFLIFNLLNSNSLIIVFTLAFILFLAANFNYLKSWSHVLLMLLTLEVLMLTNTLLISTIAASEIMASETLFMLFTLAVCEASLGVAVLVCYSRSFGNDLLQSTSVL